MNTCIKIISPPSSSRFKYINNPEIVDITRFLINNLNFLVYAGELIYECKDIEEFKKYAEQFYGENIDSTLSSEEIATNNEFMNLFFSLYSKKAKKDDFGHYRGAILERLTLLLISKRYIHKDIIHLPIECNYLLDNCEIGIDCKVRVIQDDWETPDPIDIAGWNQSNCIGEGYECKVNINKFDSSDEDILNNLFNKCKSNTYVSNFNVGLVTLSSLEGGEFFLDSYNFELYGRNNLKQLLDYQ